MTGAVCPILYRHSCLPCHAQSNLGLPLEELPLKRSNSFCHSTCNDLHTFKYYTSSNWLVTAKMFLMRGREHNSLMRYMGMQLLYSCTSLFFFNKSIKSKSLYGPIMIGGHDCIIFILASFKHTRSLLSFADEIWYFICFTNEVN